MPRQSPEARYQQYMALIEQDPLAAAQQFLGELQRSPKKNKSTLNTMQQLQQIISGDESAWQYGSSNVKDAVQFVISNALMRAMGMGVMRQPGMEGVAQDVASMISEDVDFLPLTQEQRRMKMLAESYGFAVYQLSGEELEDDDALSAEE